MKGRRRSRWVKVVLMLSACIGSADLIMGQPVINLNGDSDATNATGATNAPLPQESPKNTLTPGPTTGPNNSTSKARAIQPARIYLPPELSDILQLTRAGISNDVILAYVQKSSTPYPLNAKQLVYLRDLGVSPNVLRAMVAHQPVETWPADSIHQAPMPTMVYAPTPPPLPTTVNYPLFVNALSSYGRWLSLEGLGWCWQPAVASVNPSWQPYADNGNWLWTDCGWYWNSGYSWGWAPFHFGRWWQHGLYGWLWQPGMDWAPAWVAWRKSRDYAGWAPLPPGSGYDLGIGWSFNGTPVGPSHGFDLPSSAFAFVPYSHLADRRAMEFRVPPTVAEAVFAESKSDNNFTVGRNSHLIDWGVSPRWVQAASGKPLRRVVVRDRQSDPDPASPGIALANGMDPEYSQLPEGYQPPAFGYQNPYEPWLVVPDGPADSSRQHHRGHRHRDEDAGVLANNVGSSSSSSGTSSSTQTAGQTTAAGTGTSSGGTLNANATGNAAFGVIGQQPTARPGAAFGVVGAQANASSSATPWLPTGQTPTTGSQPPYGVPGVPIVPNNGAHPWLPVGQTASAGGAPPYGLPGVPIRPNNGANPWLPVGGTASVGGAPPYGLPGVPIRPNNGANPFLPVGQIPGSITQPPFGVPGTELAANNIGVNPFLVEGGSQFGAAAFSNPFAFQSVPRDFVSAGSPQEFTPGFPSLPSPPTLPASPTLPAPPTLPTTFLPASPTLPGGPFHLVPGLGGYRPGTPVPVHGGGGGGHK